MPRDLRRKLIVFVLRGCKPLSSMFPHQTGRADQAIKAPIDGLKSVEHGFSDIGRQEGKGHDAADIAFVVAGLPGEIPLAGSLSPESDLTSHVHWQGLSRVTLLSARLLAFHPG